MVNERVTVLEKGRFVLNPKAAKRMDKEFMAWINVRLEDLNKSISKGKE